MRCVLTALMIVGALACPVAADWVVEDGHKMHWPQLPDPTGWDVNIVWPNVVADDWKCSETGPVKNVHIWVSVAGDMGGAIPGMEALHAIESLHLSIHRDIPATDIDYSRPLDPPVRQWDLKLDKEFFINPVVFQGNQGFATPTEGPTGWLKPDHEFYYQINVPDIPDHFVQQEGEIYWLDVSVKMVDGYNGPPIGWKTTLPEWEFNDDAVFLVEDVAGGGGNWQELWENGDIGGRSLDMAFVITPEPGTLVMLFGAGLIGTLALLRRRRNRKA